MTSLDGPETSISRAPRLTCTTRYPLHSEVLHLPAIEVLLTWDAQQHKLHLAFSSPIPDREAPSQRVSCQPPTHLSPARCGIPPDHTVQERSFHRGVAIRMELPRARSIVFLEQDAFKLFGIAETLDETMYFQDLRAMRLPTSTGVHCAIHALEQANVFQIDVRASHSPHLLSSTHTHSSHRCSMEVRTADVVHRKGSFAFRLFLTARDDQREECFHSFQRWHSAEDFSCSGKVRFLHGLVDLSHDQSKTTAWSTRIPLVGVDPT